MKKTTLIIIIIAGVVIILLLGVVAYYAIRQTGFTGIGVEEEEIIESNIKQPQVLTGKEVDQVEDLITLKEQTVVVPEEFRFGVFDESQTLNLPEPFSISVFYHGLEAPRFFDFDAQGNMIVADKGAGEIVILEDNDSDGIGDVDFVVDSGLDVIHSVDFYKGDLYAGEEGQVTVYKNLKSDGSYSQKQILVDDLPTGSGHSTRTVLVGPDEKLYVSIGSSCNVCEEEDAKRAAIVRYNLDGTGQEIIAQGLRNSVGIEFLNDTLWSVDNGRDLIGDDLPPEEVNTISVGKNYGWPYCYGQGIANPEYKERADYCKNQTQFPAYEMQAHSAPLGITFFEKGFSQGVTQDLKNNLFIAFHGSWNRTTPTGYKVVRIDTRDQNSPVINFVTGWLEADGKAWGRPVGVKFGPDGALYISDDKAGTIYRVVYKQ